MDFFGRTTLPVAMLSRNEFSVWAVLRQCIGKVKTPTEVLYMLFVETSRSLVIGSGLALS